LLNWLDRFPWTLLLVVSTWMAIAPITPEPHLVEKLRFLVQGTLVRPLDIFDLALHGTPLVLVAEKLLRQWRGPRTEESMNLCSGPVLAELGRRWAAMKRSGPASGPSDRLSTTQGGCPRHTGHAAFTCSAGCPSIEASNH